MHANDTNEDGKIVYKDLSYKINGILFAVHNDLGRFGREKQYGDLFETYLKAENIKYAREYPLPVIGIKNSFTNKVDFAIDSRILIDIKAKPLVTKADYYQMNRYLEASKFKLGLVVNFRNRYLKPIRVIRANS